MYSLTQAEVAKKLDMSRATISRWVDLAQEGKNNLQLETSNNKVRILDNPHNDIELKRLTKEGQKYKNYTPLKNTSIDPEFYNLFSDEEIVEIHNDLKYKLQVKHKYVYKQPQFWDNFYKLGISPVSKANIELLDATLQDVLYLFHQKDKINLIDLGTGNGYPIKPSVEKLLKNKLLNSYIGIDISSKMLDLVDKNLQSWFPTIHTKTYTRDVETSRFGKIFLDHKSIVYEKNTGDASNLILYMDGLCNLDDRVQGLKNIRSGMSDDDLLAITFTLDTDSNKGQLNYIKDDESTMRDGWYLQMLGVDIFDCQTSVEYDEKNNRKDKLYKLDKDYIVNFNISNRDQSIKLNSGSKISTWRHYLLSVDQFQKEIAQSGLEMINMKMDKSYSYVMALCRVKY